MIKMWPTIAVNLVILRTFFIFIKPLTKNMVNVNVCSILNERKSRIFLKCSRITFVNINTPKGAVEKI